MCKRNNVKLAIWAYQKGMVSVQTYATMRFAVLASFKLISDF